MIAFVEGKIDSLTENYAVIDVNGVGYGIFISASSYYELKDVEAPVRLYTYLNVREDAQELYGFITPQEKETFLMLISVNGIGAKAGMTILGNITIDALKRAIGSENIEALTKIPGLGKKKAERIILELKDKYKGMAVKETKAGNIPDEEEYIQVLTALGFNYGQAREALKEALRNIEGTADKEKVIKEALKRLG
ncbi:MAG TPA: Holliday junction branch migration protein RuvA [Candidatus Goldiibacteriota bacterium]|nr:Holliday junction branch migration protein RuvA [Candidatus Goldiibacteriota bacterium]HPI04232.1 Holliday junction branch migration protein RuvA [Candidatus Goldiibacteriota bacterium]HPN64762.1 Holliday junction branch migration protein RuvA [Candidatus Goldiibacteriota bacterium]HRQ43646.1 Holliday junction branch migration protein RuvA [Candidatus Goldiibacteriota bacterium]